MTRAITFDLWNTLIANKDYTSVRLAALQEVLAPRGVDPGRVEEAYRAMHRRAWQQWETPPHAWSGVHDKLDHVASLLGVAFQDGERERLARTFEECILEWPPPLHPRAMEVLETAARLGKVALISDTGYSPGRVMRRVLDGHGITSFFDVLVFSDEVGNHKPHPAMFRTALEPLGIAPGDVLHVGDILRTDVAGAKAFGMRAAWLRQDGKVPGPGEVPDIVLDDLGDLLPLIDGRA